MISRLVSPTFSDRCGRFMGLTMTTLPVPQHFAVRCTSKAIKRDSIKLSKLKSGELFFVPVFPFSWK